MIRLLRLHFEQGRLTSITDEGYQQDGGGMCIPPLLLNQLLLGYRSHAEIVDVHLDVWVRPVAQQLVDVLFPKTESFIYLAI